MASTTKLIVWNAALRELGAAPIADTTTANTRQYELNAAWDHCVEVLLAQRDWGFARRRSTLAGTSDTSFPPYTYRATKPSDYLRKCWVKAAADEEYQLDHAEIAASIYLHTTTAMLEYISDHADNYDPTNWPPHFTRAATLQLAMLVGPKLARAGGADLGRLDGQMREAMDTAEKQEALFLLSTAIPTERQQVMRRALEMIGQQFAGSVELHAHADMLRWQMNRAWTHTVRYILEAGAWNFATKRALYQTGYAADTVVPATDGGIGEGYAVAPAAASSTDISISGFDYGYSLPDDYLHKIWIKADVSHDVETSHQIIGAYIFTNAQPAVMEYIATNSTTTDPDNWTANFLEAVAARLAVTVSPELVLVNGGKGVKISANEIRSKLEAMAARKLADAQMRDAIQQEPQALPMGRFARARFGGSSIVKRMN